MPHVMTVLGPVEPSTLGFTRPHEHTQIALWHVQDRWDYWELTRDEPTILEELRPYREAGGTAIVDLTMPGVGRDPQWLRRISESCPAGCARGDGWRRTGRPTIRRRP